MKYIGTKIIDAEPGLAPTQMGDYPEGSEGYKVTYPDGYISWSPKEVFEEAYRLSVGMNFGLAMEAMLKGHKVIRNGWNGNGMHLEAQIPDELSKMTHPYLFITIPKCQEGTRLLPWQPAQVDIFATDWEIVE